LQAVCRKYFVFSNLRNQFGLSGIQNSLRIV
jgi:hypothetical protein